LTLIVCDQPATAAGVYTQNLVVAAPVQVDRQRTPNDRTRAVVINSGNANACTGERGLADAVRMAELAAAACHVAAEDVLVMSTGVIGTYLPMETIAAGIEKIAPLVADDEQALLAAAHGIMTTDAFHKVSGRQLQVAGSELRITGMAKGAGMIGPNMATMLAVVMTDAAIAPEDAQHALSSVVDETFNCIHVDGHTSTNDTVLLLASGAAGGAAVAGAQLDQFRAALLEVCADLARAIPTDGEGASHLITIEVRGCRDAKSAKTIAHTVAHSPLVKTAISGADPNWGRIVSAVGYAGVPLDPDKIELRINGFLLYQNGRPVDFDAPTVSRSIRDNPEARIEIDLAEGDASGRVWGADLTPDYVRFNSEYTT
jgi:glutamate N-acetyltransferase/amino-acid N-acetyltransferase